MITLPLISEESFFYFATPIDEKFISLLRIRCIVEHRNEVYRLKFEKLSNDNEWIDFKVYYSKEISNKILNETARYLMELKPSAPSMEQFYKTIRQEYDENRDGV